MTTRIGNSPEPATTKTTVESRFAEGRQSEHTAKEPGIGELLLNRAGAVVMAPVVTAASTIYLGVKSAEGIFTAKPYGQAMQEGLDGASQGADMLDKMWNGKYF